MDARPGAGHAGDGHKKFLYTRPVVCVGLLLRGPRCANCKASDTLPTPPMSALHVRMKFIERIKEIVAQYPDGISIEQVTHANGIAHDDPERAPKEEDAKTVSNLTFIYVPQRSVSRRDRDPLARRTRCRGHGRD